MTWKITEPCNAQAYKYRRGRAYEAYLARAHRPVNLITNQTTNSNSQGFQSESCQGCLQLCQGCAFLHRGRVGYKDTRRRWRYVRCHHHCELSSLTKSVPQWRHVND